MTTLLDDVEFFDAVPEAAACLRPLRAHECNGATLGSRLVFVSRAEGGRFIKEITSWPPVGPQRIALNQADAPVFLRLIRNGLNGPARAALNGVLASLYLQNVEPEGCA